MSEIVDEKNAPPARTPLVLAGGGMSAAFSAGVLQGLGELGLTRFDVALAVSASAPTLAYFAAGQLEEIGRIWNEHVPTAEVVQSSRRARASESNPIVFDTDHLVDVIFRKRVPLDVAALMRSPLACRFVAGRILTPGSIELEAFDEQSTDIWQALKACMALPGLSRWPISVDEGRFVDAGVLDPMPLSLEGQPLAGRSIVVLNAPRTRRETVACQLARRVLGSLETGAAQFADTAADFATRYASSHDRLQEAEARGETLVIAPDRPTPAPLATTRRSKIERTLKMGHETVMRMEASIRGYLCGSSMAAVRAWRPTECTPACRPAEARPRNSALEPVFA